MKRWLRSVLRRCRIDVPFRDVVCPHHVKTIRVVDGARIEVIDRRSLVFLDLPEPGELRDLVPITADGESVAYISPDALELERTSTHRGTLISWMPREPLVRYALYAHQYGWMSAAGSDDAVLYTEFCCEMNTGLVDLELLTAGKFEAAVSFKRPRWRRLANDHSLVKYALGRLESENDRPAILEEGARLQWKLVGPKIGERYVCVVFQENGVQQWRERLEAKSLSGRMRRLIGRPLAST